MSMKSYLRYEPAESFGVITSPQCNIVYDTTGNLAITGANSRVNVVNMRTHTTVGSIEAENQNYPYVLPGEVRSTHSLPHMLFLVPSYFPSFLPYHTFLA